MNYTTVNISEGRKILPQIVREVDEHGKIYILNVHGKNKVAIVDFELFQEFIENAEYGISKEELTRRSSEPRLNLEELKKAIDV